MGFSCYFRRFPFDWQNPFGFLVAIVAEYAMFLYGFTIGGCVFVLAIGSFLYAISLSRDNKDSLCTITRNSQAKTDRSILWEQLTKLHANSKQLSETKFKYQSLVTKPDKLSFSIQFPFSILILVHFF